MKKTYIFLGLIILVIIGIWLSVDHFASKPDFVACTADAMQCPDGSYVGRTGPMCEFAPCPIMATTTQVTTGDVSVGVGQTGKAGDLSITFNKFIQDSRCPVDVQCIQAGAVTVNVTLADATKTETRNLASDEVPYVFDRYYKISITGILPARSTKVQIPPNAYKVTFHVEKVTIPIPPSVLKGVLTGSVVLSPTCPVERNPPDPNCAPKGYQTTVTILGATSTEVITTTQTKTDGTFIITIPFGEYTAHAGSGAVYPRCQDVPFSLQGATKSISIACDTGIR